MDVVEVTIHDDISKEIETTFENERSASLTIDRSTLAPQIKPAGMSELKHIQSMPVTHAIHPHYVLIAQARMPEAIALLRRLDGVRSTVVHIKNAPLKTRFGKGNDSQYQDQFPHDYPLINDRWPTAELALLALAEAAGLDIDSFPNDNHGKIFSYATPLAEGKGRNNEEHGADDIFDLHTDGSMNREPSEFIMLAAGIGADDAKTIIVDPEKLLRELQLYDGDEKTQVVQILSLPIFKHIPGTSSVDTNDVLVAPILNISPSGKIFFRGNFAENKTGKRIDLIDGLSDEQRRDATEAMRIYKKLALTPENHISIVINTGDAVFFSNGPHARTSFKTPKDPAEHRYLARFGGRSSGWAERFENIAVAEAGKNYRE